MGAGLFVATGALLNRVNYAIPLTSNKIRGVQVDINSLVGADVEKRILIWLSNGSRRNSSQARLPIK